MGYVQTQALRIFSHKGAIGLLDKSIDAWTGFYMNRFLIFMPGEHGSYPLSIVCIYISFWTTLYLIIVNDEKIKENKMNVSSFTLFELKIRGLKFLLVWSIVVSRQKHEEY